MVVYVLVFEYDGLVLNILNEYGIVCHYIQDPYSEGDAPAMSWEYGASYFALGVPNGHAIASSCLN